MRTNKKTKTKKDRQKLDLRSILNCLCSWEKSYRQDKASEQKKKDCDLQKSTEWDSYSYLR